MRVDFRGLKCATALRSGFKAAMYESSCSYAGALELKRSALKEEPWPAAEWPPYRLHQSTFEQLKQSVEKAKAVLQDRSGLLGTATAFGDFYGGQLGQDGSGTALGLGRTSRTDETMLASIDKNKIGTEKLASGLTKGYTPSLSDTLRTNKCSAKTELKKVQDIRRSFRQKYHEQWLEAKVKEKTRILRFKEGYIMDDITDEIREWFRIWYKKARVFDEYPWPEEGGTILVVRGDTFTVEEYLDWRVEEEKRLKKEAGNPKTKEQIKAEKLEAKMELLRIENDAKEKEKKRIIDYKKSRLNPANDPGVYVKLGYNFNNVQSAWFGYENQWNAIDVPYASVDVIKGYIKELLTEEVCKDIQIQLRAIVDTMMKLELNHLKTALKNDYNYVGAKLPITQKRKKPKKMKKPKPDKIPPIQMFQELFDEGIIRDYPRLTLEDFWGDRNYGAADLRAIEWTPSFPPACLGDVKEQVRIRCLLTLGCSCPDANRSIILVGPAGSGKRSLVYALATETNALLIDLSPFNIYNKFPGAKNMKNMLVYVNRISRLMQPTIILVANADKTFYKKVPPQEKMFEPTRLQRDFFKEITKAITETDKILVVGTASEPWLSKGGQMLKAFPSIILFPRSDYGSISYILKRTLMQYHGVKREFDVHSLAQVLRGFDVNAIKKGVETLLCPKRVAELKFKPLQPYEVLFAVMDVPNCNYVDLFDYGMFWQWYLANSPWGPEYLFYMAMLESQLVYKMKEKKKKK